jgi:diguanylate cyclase (GGDEF)-like protein
VDAMKQAIIRLSQGDLDSKVENVKMDAEFRLVALFFNRMTRRLRRSTVTKQELQQEVARQTREIQQHHEKLLYLSEHDPLTNLINRRAFDKQLDNSIVKAQRSGLKLAVLFIDLDEFKHINDTYGHDVGDAVLVEVANRLSDSIRVSDFVGRLGGDEFVVCLDLLKDLSVLSAKVEQIQSAINEPIVFGERLVSVGASIGISCYPDHSKNRERLMRLADKAMYQAKQTGTKEKRDARDVIKLVSSEG